MTNLTAVLGKVVGQQEHEKNPNYHFALSSVGRLDDMPIAKMAAIRSDIMMIMVKYETSEPPRYYTLVGHECF